MYWDLQDDLNSKASRSDIDVIVCEDEKNRKALAQMPSRQEIFARIKVIT
jgi:hypothetical protein